jgi:hypothetical protein
MIPSRNDALVSSSVNGLASSGGNMGGTVEHQQKGQLDEGVWAFSHQPQWMLGGSEGSWAFAQLDSGDHGVDTETIASIMTYDTGMWAFAQQIE